MALRASSATGVTFPKLAGQEAMRANKTSRFLKLFLLIEILPNPCVTAVILILEQRWRTCGRDVGRNSEQIWTSADASRPRLARRGMERRQSSTQRNQCAEQWTEWMGPLREASLLVWAG